MAAPTSAKRLLMVGALVVVLTMLAAHPTEASSFTFYNPETCSGCHALLDTCGCSNVPSNTHGSYKFDFTTGHPAAAYNEPGCTGPAATRFDGRGTQQCSPVGWKSVLIQC